MSEKTRGAEQDLPMAEIYSDHEFNCRGDTITPGSVMELAADIQANPVGLMQRIIVQPWKHEFDSKYKYRIVCGHRRYAACKILKWKTIPAVVYEGLSVEDAEAMNLSENLKRKDLNILQEAKALDKMAARGMAPSVISKKLDVGLKWVTDRLALLTLPEDVQREAEAGIIKAAHVVELCKYYMKSPDKMYEAVRSIKNTNGRRKIQIKKVHVQTKTIKREFRPMSEVFRVQDICTEAIGTNLASKAIAWCIGEISLLDLMKEIKAEADLMTIPWSIPTDIIQEDARIKKEEEKKAALLAERDTVPEVLEGGE